MDVLFEQARDRLLQLLNNDPDVFAVESFMRGHEVLLRRAFEDREVRAIKWSPHLEVMVPDVAVLRGSQWIVISFETPQYPIFLSRNKPVSSVANSLDELRTLREWMRTNPKDASPLEGLNGSFEGVVFAGNREHLDPRELEYLREYNASLELLSIRTYNWLIDQQS